MAPSVSGSEAHPPTSSPIECEHLRLKHIQTRLLAAHLATLLVDIVQYAPPSIQQPSPHAEIVPFLLLSALRSAEIRPILPCRHDKERAAEPGDPYQRITSTLEEGLAFGICTWVHLFRSATQHVAGGNDSKAYSTPGW